MVIQGNPQSDAVLEKFGDAQPLDKLFLFFLLFRAVDGKTDNRLSNPGFRQADAADAVAAVGCGSADHFHQCIAEVNGDLGSLDDCLRYGILYLFILVFRHGNSIGSERYYCLW